MVSIKLDAACSYLALFLTDLADPIKAPQMQAYMKTNMPFYGVQKAGRVPILRHVVRQFPPESGDEYREMVLGLWDLPHREEKYLALGYARHFKSHIVPAQVGLYRRLIVEGAWWDFVDEVATKLIGHLVREFPEEAWPDVDDWIGDEDMWLRRTAIICQMGAKDRTDAHRLFRFCEARTEEKEFFIRKAIGWALREYSKTDPSAVATFVNSHAAALSGLSFREASKHIPELVDPQ